MDVANHRMRDQEIVDPEAPGSPESSLEFGDKRLLRQEEGRPRCLDHRWWQNPLVHRLPQHAYCVEPLVLESDLNGQDKHAITQIPGLKHVPFRYLGGLRYFELQQDKSLGQRAGDLVVCVQGFRNHTFLQQEDTHGIRSSDGRSIFHPL